MEVSEDYRKDTHRLAAKLASEGREDVAYAKYAELLNANFNDFSALYGLGKLYLAGEHYGLAYNIFRMCASVKGLGSAPWNGMGLCQAETYDLDLALQCFRKAREIDPGDAMALSNMALAFLLKNEPDKAIEFANMALRIRDLEDTKHHLAYAHLLKGNWREGWEGHSRILGKVKTRTERLYENRGRMLPRWDGEPGKVVLVYGEQGIGDEISFASCIPDLVKVSKKVIFDCDHRLEFLFRRSFKDVEVHGTRFKDPTEWIDGQDIDARVAIGDLPGFFRNSREDFPGAAYLRASAGAGAKWKSLFDGKVKPVIGVAWTGGKANTGSSKRSLRLEDLAPFLKTLPATWVSLEYKERTEEMVAFQARHGVEILDFPNATRSANYDDAASLVGSLDLVISATTAVVHLAGALGKECWCLVPNTPRWFYGSAGDSLPWYKSVKLFRQDRHDRWPVEDVRKLLTLRYA